MKVVLNDEYNKLYDMKTYISKDYLVLKLESESGKYSKQYNLEQLKQIDRYFNMSRNLEEAQKDLNELFGEKYSILEKDEEDVTIQFKRNNIKFILDNIQKVDISYESLSDYMKKIIDENQLILGIDLGTTYSCAAVMIDNNIIMIRNSLGSTTTPSYISFIDKNEVYVGELAKLLPSNEKNIIYNTKRLLGKNIEDDDIKELMQKLPFSLKKDEKYNLLKICLNFDYGKTKGNNEEEFYPEQISALILRKIIKDSEFYLSKRIGKEIKINNCVITVPAYFNQKQRESTYNSAKIIGLNVKTMINEPTAACLAYAFQSLENSDKKMIVIDFGGGTLDITQLRYRKDKDSIYCDVKFTYGNSNFGGEDFDKKLMEKCKEKCFKNPKKGAKNLKNEDKNEPQIIRLKRACERAKIKLSTYDSTEIHFENDIDFTINKKDFLDYCKELFDKFNKILDDFIIQSKINKNEISEVILIGGSTLIPKIREIISEKFKKSKINYKLDPKEVVAMGASIRAAKLSRLPSVQDIKLFDVTNLSLGVRVQGNRFKRIIPRSTPIPFSNTDTFKTTLDNQDFAVIKIYEGENDNDCDIKNLLLGKFFITGLPKRKGGEVKIEVKFHIKENSILEVTATEVMNPNNIQELIIEKQNDPLKILSQLEKRENEINFFEDKKYNDLKFSIMESQDNLRYQKNKKNIKDEYLKKIIQNIIEKIGTFLIECEIFSNIYISFVKFYFNNLCEFYQIYNINDSEDLSQIKSHLSILLEKIQFYDNEILNEILEENIDNDNVYKNFKGFIMECLYAEINSIFFNANRYKREKDRKIYDEILKEISRAKALIKVSKQLIDKVDKDKCKLNNITKKDLEVIDLKLTVREEIIEMKNKNSFMKFFYSIRDQNKLKGIYEKYCNCILADGDDLVELEKLINDMVSQRDDKNFNLEWEKAERFIKSIKCKNANDDIICTIHEILELYPYEKKNEQEMWNNFYKYKSGEYSLDEYLLLIRGKYQTKANDIKTTSIETEVYHSILTYLNKIS